MAIRAAAIYAGCEHVDKVETAAIDRAKELFGAEFVNVQTHSDTQVNGAVKRTWICAASAVMSIRSLSTGRSCAS